MAVVRIPALRARGRDSVLLARTFLARTCRRYGVPTRTLSTDAEAVILRYPWPGNIRELANTMERVILLSDADPVGVADLDLPAVVASSARLAVGSADEIQVDLPDAGVSLEAIERAVIVRGLEKAGGNQSAAARLLGLSRDTLRYRMEKHGLLGDNPPAG